MSTIAGISVTGCLRTTQESPEQAKSSKGRSKPDEGLLDRPDDDEDGIPNYQDDFPKNPEYFALVASVQKTIILEPGEYKYYEISPNGLADIIYSIETTNNKMIDAFITNEKYVSKIGEKDWKYYNEGSMLNTNSGHITITVDASQTYYVVFDNSAILKASPSVTNATNPTKVKINLKVKRRSAPVRD